MLPSIEQPQKLINPKDVLDYEAVVEHFPWIVERDRKCILSTDSDGFLCGLAMVNLLNWKVVGFYDGKLLLLDSKVKLEECSFLDVEINRKGVSSIGNHLIQFNKTVPVPNFNFDNCIQPNIIRGFDGRVNFQQKYPFATIHLVLGILQHMGAISRLNQSTAAPLIFVDGTGNNLFGYPENCLDWIRFLGIDKKDHILNPFLCDSKLNFYQTMQYLKGFFALRDRYNAKGYYNGVSRSYQEGGRNIRTGHQLKISNTRAETINLVSERNGLVSIHKKERERVIGFIKEMARLMDWEYKEKQWAWEGLKVKLLQKGMLTGESLDPQKRLNNKTYQVLFTQNPISLAMTASNRIEYTVERS